MKAAIYKRKGYWISALLGAIGGGIFVAIATQAIPTILARMMAGMMRNMLSQMKMSGCKPQEI